MELIKPRRFSKYLNCGSSRSLMYLKIRSTTLSKRDSNTGVFLENVFKTFFKTSSKTSSRSLQDVFQDVFKTSSRRICKASSSRRLERQKNVTLKTSSRRLQDVSSTSSSRRMFLGTLLKINYLEPTFVLRFSVTELGSY